jgi:AraC-like DNA-binding protein
MRSTEMHARRTEDLEYLPFPTLLLKPPYLRPERLPNITRLCPRQLDPGTLLVVELEKPEAAWPNLQQWLPRLRAAHPGAPLVLWVPGEVGAGDLANLARRAGRLGVRAVLTRYEAIEDTLRATLTEPVRLEADIVEWFGLRGVSVSPELGFLIQQIFYHAPAQRTLADVLRVLRLPASSVGAKFSKKTLPPPSTWLHLAHALHAVLRLQAAPADSLSKVALDLGYSDHSALSRQITRNFGLRPSEIRCTLGWEWLLERWVSRCLAPAPRLRAVP